MQDDYPFEVADEQRRKAEIAAKIKRAAVVYAGACGAIYDVENCAAQNDFMGKVNALLQEVKA